MTTSRDNTHIDPSDSGAEHIAGAPTGDPSASRSPAQAYSGPGYETIDVNIAAILWLGGGVFAGTLLVMAGLLLLQQKYMSMADERDPELSPLQERRERPPAPRLQAIEAFETIPRPEGYMPGVDYQEYLVREEQILASYGVVEQGEEPDQTVFRIPIARAMELLMEQGLPPVEPQSPQQDLPRDDTPSLEPGEPQLPDRIDPQQR
jgi:hypothetical protein